jgi:alkylated DNA repair dioxygenase AlkB
LKTIARVLEPNVILDISLEAQRSRTRPVTDLFSNDGELLAIPVPDADLSYTASMALPAPPEALLRELIDGIPWRAEDIVVWGKKYRQPRLMAWYGDRGRRYTYSGIRLEPLPWTERLASIRAHVEHTAEAAFNSVLLNYYRDQNDSMGMHSDDEPELGSRPAIASLSLGHQRTLILKHRTRKDLQRVTLPLQSGSLLLMKGETQRHWKHGIAKERRPCGPRINLTFRRIVGSAASDEGAAAGVRRG